MRVLMRLDSSLQIGTGHLMRCLTLADGLRRRGAQIAFACRALEGSLAPMLESQGYAVHDVVRGDPRPRIDALLPDWEADAAATARVARASRADWIAVDHYGLDARWEESVRRASAGVMAVDDLANRRHACDVLLDQNYYRDGDTRYEGLVPAGAVTLLGPRYALLRPDFESYRARGRSRAGEVRRILVFLGGTDPDNVTHKVVSALQRVPAADLQVHVVVGGTNPHRHDIQSLCAADARFSYECQARDMAALMAESDLAVGAGGATTWERCYLGLPAIVVATGENQVRTNEDIAALGVCRYLGRASELTIEEVAAAVEEVMADPGAITTMSRKAMAIMGDEDALPTSRVVDALINHRHAGAGDRGRNTVPIGGAQ
jgi:UDP-2,4-diacetamido-2,4,6-trideoxy-beta-L-altropyranose hydrolase